MVGAEAFVFSSDFPHEVNNDICKHEIEELLEAEALTQAEKELHPGRAMPIGSTV